MTAQPSFLKGENMILTWYIPGVLSETGIVGSNISTEYTLDKDYRPARLLLRLKTVTAADGEPLIVDINEKKFGYTERESIFSDDKPSIASEEAEFKGWSNKVLQKDSVISLDIDQVSPTTPGKDLTVQFDLEEA